MSKGKAIFPRLRHLSWELLQAPSRYLSVFLSRDLTHIKMDMKNASYVEHEAALASIAQYTETLGVTLTIHRVVHDDGRPAQSLFATIGGLARLLSVEVRYHSELNMAIVGMLAYLPVLHRLKIHSSSFLSSKMQFHPEAFCDLQELCVYQESSLEIATTFMQLAHTVPLKKINIGGISTQPPFEIMQEFITTLRERCRPDTLTYISIQYVSSHKPLLDARSIIEPLLDFPNILDLTLDLPMFFTSIDDDFFKRMVAAWPHLEKLVLLEDELCEIAPHSRVTLDGLRALAACPNLATLRFPFDLSCDIRAFAAHPLPQTRKPELSNLRYLSVGRSINTNPFKLAATLSLMIPNLKKIDWYIDDSDSAFDDTSAWEDFEKAYALCIKVRRQERGLNELVGHGIGADYGI